MKLFSQEVKDMNELSNGAKELYNIVSEKYGYKEYI